MKRRSNLSLVGVVTATVVIFAPSHATQAADTPDRTLHIIVFGAHPDDCELKAGGTAARWAALGHKVKFVSVTNGDIGHWKMKGEALAERRLAEVKAAANVLGIETQVLPSHDGELEPTLENRRTITRLIREWQADIVLCHRPWDYHPDHRYVGVLVQDAAYMVTVPFFCPETPHLKQNPVFMYLSDRFQKPYAFRPDVVVAIDEVYDRKIDALHELVSQIYEGGANGSEALVKTVPPADDLAGRKAWLRKSGWGQGARGEANRFRSQLVKWYGPEKGNAVQYAEAFEVVEYGRRPSAEELKRLFPFFDAKTVSTK
jgi:N-acetylglucosamine malate deacetylase 1